MSPTGRAVIESPFAAAALISASVWRQRSGARSFWVIENEIGHLVFSATRSIIGRSSCSVERSSTNCSTLRPSLCMAAAIAVSSSSPAFSVGVKSPVEVRWLRVREVEKPSAPERTASRASLAIASLSSGVEGSRRAPQLRPDVDVEIAFGEPLHVVRKAFPEPGDAGAQHRLGDVLDALHQLDQAQMVVRPAWREADAAIAHHRGRDAVLRGWRHVLTPGDLAVVMRVDVDKARRDQLAARVDFVAALARNLTDLADSSVPDRDIGLEQIAAASIGNGTAADHKVWTFAHGVSSRVFFGSLKPMFGA